MPELIGIELIAEIRAIRPDLPVILCTGYSDLLNINDLVAKDIAYLGKPVDPQKLIQLAGSLVHAGE